MKDRVEETIQLKHTLEKQVNYSLFHFYFFNICTITKAETMTII